ncbi:hypothetical protein HMPREF9061_00827 [Actinomyces sp. oral taxon 181 str. F0379]|nr:hypothetical protein HMPREF9061_00827 [Actinomyces sp. oral taxon 181 str. F0379]
MQQTQGGLKVETSATTTEDVQSAASPRRQFPPRFDERKNLWDAQ